MGFPGPQNGTATPVPGPHLWRPHLWNDTDFPVCTEHTGFRTPRRQSDIGLPAPNSSPPVRPSGTEPKIKFYIAVVGETNEESQAKIANIEAEINAFVGE